MKPDPKADMSLAEVAATVLRRPEARRRELAAKMRQRARCKAAMVGIHDVMGGGEAAAEAAEDALACWLAADALERGAS